MLVSVLFIKCPLQVSALCDADVLFICAFVYRMICWWRWGLITSTFWVTLVHQFGLCKIYFVYNKYLIV